MSCETLGAKMNLEVLSEKVGFLARECGQMLSKEASRYREIVIEAKVGGENPCTQVVTAVDRRLEKILQSGLEKLLPRCDVGWLGEEGGDDGSRLQTSCFWCVDPLDGTQAFVEGLPGISISIALVGRDGTSRLGMVLDPLENALYHAFEGGGCWRDGKRIGVDDHGPVGVLWDRTWQRHPEGERLRSALEKKGWVIQEVAGGAVMSVVSLLEGRGCYFKFPKKAEGGGSLWDFAATACLMKEAGGQVSDVRGDDLMLNPSDTTFMNSFGVIFATSCDLQQDVIELHRTLGSASSS